MKGLNSPYVLRNADRQLDTESISAATGVNVTDIPEALEYWVNMGILAKNNDVLSPIESKSSDIKTEPVQEPAQEPEKPVESVEDISREVNEAKQRFVVTKPQKPSPLKGLRWTRNLKSLFRKLSPLSEKRCQIPTPQRF